MSMKLEISFAPSALIEAGLVLSLKEAEATLPAGAATVDPSGIFAKAAATAKFKAKAMSVLDILAPTGSKADRLIVIGTGKAADLVDHDWLRLGGVAAANLKGSEAATVFLDAEG